MTDKGGPNHRQDYSPLKLLLNGRRMIGGYTEEDAIRDYVALHPGARKSEVRLVLKPSDRN